MNSQFNWNNMGKKIAALFGLSILVWLLTACGQTAPVVDNETNLVIGTSATPSALNVVDEANLAIKASPTPSTIGADCAVDAIPDFSGYPDWAKVNPAPIKGHEVWVNIFVNEQAKDIYLAGSGDTFPVCAKIVKTHLLSGDSDFITAVTVMVKMAPGYDPEHNDWWWGMYDGKGETAEMSGKVQVCIDCHQPVAAEDYVFSKAVLSAAGE